eukprot:jgi/Psemu1/8564/gm1.8564_g
MSVENNLKAALRNQSYATDEFSRNLSLEVTRCFTALTTKVYLVSSIIKSKPRPDFRKTTSSTSWSEKKDREKKKKLDTTFSDLGPIPWQIDVMVNLFLYEVDNGVNGVLELLTRKQISKQFKDYDLNNKWLNFKALLGNVEDKIRGGSLYGRNMVNYATIKKYMIMYRKILVWYMKNVQYPPGPDSLWFHTKCQNGSPHDSKQYVHAMKNFLDCLMAKSSLRVSLSHSHNQKWVPVGFHQQGDTNVPKTGQVILPLHSPLVFNYAIHYKDTVSNYYNIHFEFDDNHVTLSPCKLGTGKIDLAPFTVTKGIIYLVNEWLIRKVVNPGKNLGANREHVMEKMVDLVLTERRFLGGAMLPKLSEEDVAYCQRNDRLYIYPLAKGLRKTKFAHVKFEDKPEQLVTGLFELLGLEAKHNNQTCVTRFLQYDVNSQQEVHQQIFMEHIPYMFCEIFVIDPQVVERYTWVQELIIYSYLPELGTIFTPLTDKPSGYLLEKSDDLLSANILVEFLEENVVNNYGRGTGELNTAFNHLQGCDFVFHKLSDFETWDCFKTSKGDIKKFNKSQNGYQVGWVMFTFNTTNQSKSGFIPPWVVKDQSQNNSNHPHNRTNEERGSPDTGASSKQKAKLSKPSQIDTTKGNSMDAGTGDGNQITQTRTLKLRSNNKCGSTDKGNTIESKEEVSHLARQLIRGPVKVPKYPLRN